MDLQIKGLKEVPAPRTGKRQVRFNLAFMQGADLACEVRGFLLRSDGTILSPGTFLPTGRKYFIAVVSEAMETELLKRLVKLPLVREVLGV